MVLFFATSATGTPRSTFCREESAHVTKRLGPTRRTNGKLNGASI